MIAPDAFIQSLYDNDVPFSIVDVRDVAQAIFNSAITKGLHGKNHLLASETYRVSDCLLYTSPSPRDRTRSRMPSSA